MVDLMIDLDKLQNLVTTPDGWQAQCPLCFFNFEDQKNRNHLGIQRNGKFNCLKYSGDSAHLKGILDLVGVNSDGVLKNQYIVNQEPKLSIPESWPLDIIKGLIKNYDYWENRGVGAETCNEFEIGLAFKGQLNQRIVHPIFNPQRTKILGFSARTLINIEPRWKILGEKKQFLYPIWLNEKIIQEKGEIILVEGIGCVLTLWENGIKNSICLFGTQLSSKVISFLITVNPRKIIIALNNEESNIGLNAANKAKNILSNFFSEDKIEIRLPFKKDFNEMDNEEVKNWYEFHGC